MPPGPASAEGVPPPPAAEDTPPAAVPAPPPAAAGATPAAPSAFTPNSEGGPSVAIATYDPKTGQYATPDGNVYRQSDLVNPGVARSWKDLMPTT